MKYLRTFEEITTVQQERIVMELGEFLAAFFEQTLNMYIIDKSYAANDFSATFTSNFEEPKTEFKFVVNSVSQFDLSYIKNEKIKNLIVLNLYPETKETHQYTKDLLRYFKTLGLKQHPWNTEPEKAYYLIIGEELNKIYKANKKDFQVSKKASSFDL